jgi:hypothetical protein
MSGSSSDPASLGILAQDPGYNATLAAATVILDRLEEVVGIACAALDDPPDAVAVRVWFADGADPLALAALFHVGAVVVGGAEWGCVDAGGEALPFYLQVTSAEAPLGSVLSLRAKPVSPLLAFDELALVMWSEPPPAGPAPGRRLFGPDSKDESLGVKVMNGIKDLSSGSVSATLTASTAGSGFHFHLEIEASVTKACLWGWLCVPDGVTISRLSAWFEMALQVQLDLQVEATAGGSISKDFTIVGDVPIGPLGLAFSLAGVSFAIGLRGQVTGHAGMSLALSFSLQAQLTARTSMRRGIQYKNGAFSDDSGGGPQDGLTGSASLSPVKGHSSASVEIVPQLALGIGASAFGLGQHVDLKSRISCLAALEANFDSSGGLAPIAAAIVADALIVRTADVCLRPHVFDGLLYGRLRAGDLILSAKGLVNNDDVALVPPVFDVTKNILLICAGGVATTTTALVTTTPAESSPEGATGTPPPADQVTTPEDVLDETTTEVDM